MANLLTLPLPGTLGNVAGGAADGVLMGAMTFDDPDSVQRRSLAAASGLCITDDGGLYVNETTPFNEDTGDDVEVLPATPAVDDAVYFGLASGTFGQVDLNITTQGAGTWTIQWQYWNGTAWTALSGVTDGTTGFTATTGIKSVTFTIPSDWAKNTVDSVNAYWIRANVTAYTSVTTAPQVGQGWIILTSATAEWTDDTTDFTDAGAGDVDLLPAYPVEGDALFVGYSEKFCKIKLTTSQELSGTATITAKYWDGSAWSSVSVVEDDSAGYTGSPGTFLIHFVPPSDWTANTAANGPNGETGYFISLELTSLTSITQQPLATRGYVLPLKTGASGIPAPTSGRITNVKCNANTVSGSTADSKFILVNTTSGNFATVTWTKAVAFDSETVSLAVNQDQQLALVQITEDGSTEFGDASMALTY